MRGHTSCKRQLDNIQEQIIKYIQEQKLTIITQFEKTT